MGLIYRAILGNKTALDSENPRPILDKWPTFGTQQQIYHIVFAGIPRAVLTVVSHLGDLISPIRWVYF